MTGAHDTQWTDLTTKETIALVELVNSIQNGTTDTSHTRNTVKGKAAKPMAERMNKSQERRQQTLRCRQASHKREREETWHHRGNESNRQTTKTQP